MKEKEKGLELNEENEKAEKINEMRPRMSWYFIPMLCFHVINHLHAAKISSVSKLHGHVFVLSVLSKTTK